MRNKVGQQPAQERIRNFSEVSLGFSQPQAEQEAGRCIQCKDPPCVKGCPVGIDIPAFIKLIKEGRRGESLEKIKQKNNLPAVCGRVCPQEEQCEVACVLNKKGMSINIGALERYAADYELTHQQDQRPKVNGQLPFANCHLPKVAVVGSGPAGLTCAADLVKIGYTVTLFESLHIAGGVLSYGIPEFRLPKKIIAGEVDYIRGLGVTIRTDCLIGCSLGLKELFREGFKAVFLGTGAGLPQFLGIPGENLARIYSANEFLTRINLMKAYLFPEFATPINIGVKVAVIGGGNVAFDSARCALRLGSEATIVYRRTEKEMPARIEEIENAKAEGVKFHLLTQPVRFSADAKGRVGGLECIKMELGEPDSSGRRRPLAVKGSEFILDVDTVVVAIGQRPNPLLMKTTPELKTRPEGTLQVNADFMTSIPGVFAGGDIITGADTVISAMGAGKKAAQAIDRYLKTADNITQ